MYNEGILDPEFATQTHEDYIAKIASGRVVALLDTDWDYSDGEKVLKADGSQGTGGTCRRKLYGRHYLPFAGIKRTDREKDRCDEKQKP